MSTQSADSASLLLTALNAARVAGEVHLAAHSPLVAGAPGADFQVQSKTHLADLVTRVDLQAEVAIRHVLTRAWPDLPILGEENAWPAEELAQLNTRSCWVVDPLDGTQNFVTGLPLSCVSVAYLERGEPLVGVVYNPTTGELYSAVRGQGAYLNGARLSVSSRSNLETPALLATGFPRDIARKPHLLKPFIHLTGRGLPVRRLGTAALTLAFMAAGRIDGYWDVKLAPWDVAAGLLLLTEAGGQVTNTQGEPYGWNGTMCATNGWIHAELLEVTALAAEPDELR